MYNYKITRKTYCTAVEPFVHFQIDHVSKTIRLLQWKNTNSVSWLGSIARVADKNWYSNLPGTDDIYFKYRERK